MATLSLKAPAKVNLTLEAVGKRDDGYHEIASVLQTVGLFDHLAFRPADDLTLQCDRPELATDDNLVLRAADLLKTVAGYSKGAVITLEKKIPVSSGLGGGSSDAAATLTGLNDLWGLGMSNDDLMPIAARLGSDVPFFLRAGTAMAQGRGERVRQLPPADIEWLVVLCPAIHISNKTASLYGRLTPAHYTPGHLTRKLEARIRGGGDVPPQFLFNVFDEVARQTFPGLDTYWDAFYSLGAREIHVAGSGPALFAPVARKERGTTIELMLKHRHGWQAHLVSTWPPTEEGAREGR